MRSLLLVLLLALGACVDAPADAQVAGTYELVRINGDTLPARSPAGGPTLFEAMTWVLAPDSSCTWRITLHNPHIELSTTLDFTGVWHVEGPTLVIQMDFTEPEEFRWTLRNGRLRVIDERNDEYLFARRAAATRREGARTDSGHARAPTGSDP